MTTVTIKEQSWAAWIAAKVLHTQKVALVINKTIHLHNTSRTVFLNNTPWLLHELKHIEQYERLGVLRFILLYLLESLKKGYRENKYEQEARAAERDMSQLNKYTIV